MTINNKLKGIASLVSKNKTVLDLGCDHAYLAVYLAKTNKFLKIIASDSKIGPLNQARKNIKDNNLTKKIETRLGNGLEVYTNDIDTVIISGMGGRNIKGILRSDLAKTKNVSTYIISPNNYQSEIKRYLVSIGYKIEDELLVKDSKIIYQIIRFTKGRKRYTNKEYFFGPILLTKKDNLFKEYYQKELLSREILLNILPKSYFYKRFITKREIKMLKKELN